MAAEKLGTPVDKLQVKDGCGQRGGHARSKSISYGKLVAGKRIERHIAQGADPKPVADCKLMGTSVPRVDAIEKVTGKAKYSADLAMPGTLYARVVRLRRTGRSCNRLTPARRRKPACRSCATATSWPLVGDKPDLVDKALGLVKAEWQREPDGLDDQNIYAHLSKFESKLELVSEKGSLADGEKLISTALEGKSGVLERTYTTAYAYHAPMETHSNVARFEDGKLTLWAATQIPFAAKDDIARKPNLTSRTCA